MPTKAPPLLDESYYEKAAQVYLENLPPEHFMEPTPQATQREITLASLALVRRRRPEVQYFNELLVQYPRPRKKKLGQVVPDNMVVIHSEPIKAIGSYDLPFQPVRPFWMLEYVTKRSQRKDYIDNKHKYEHELKVPYYLIFDPEKKELTLYHHMGEAFIRVEPDEHGRFPIKELDLSVAVLDGWVRFWYQGELLPLPAELQTKLDETRRRLDAAVSRADAAESRADAAESRADAAERENEQLRAQLQELQARQKGNS